MLAGNSVVLKLEVIDALAADRIGALGQSDGGPFDWPTHGDKSWIDTLHPAHNLAHMLGGEQ